MELTQTGLSTTEVRLKLQEVGPNKIEGKRRVPLILQFLGQFKDFMVLILIAASVVAYFAGETIDASIILGIVFLNAAIGFFQEFKAERAVEALKNLLSPKARVMRSGQELMIEACDLVPGDLLILQEGDKVGADCELIEENELYADEAILTGESLPLKKDIEKNKKLFMGTQVVRGNGKAIVTKTGMHTEFGKIALLTTETKKDKSPLQKELAHIGALVGKITIGISALLFFVGYFAQKREFIDSLLFSVSVAVAAVPEGLPTTITVALALGVQRLARKNAIVKQLSSVETLGSTTVICTDKTGTLTKNEMTVQEMIIDGYTILVHGIGYAPEGSFSIHRHSSKNSDYFEYDKSDLPELGYKKPELHANLILAFHTATICNNARLTRVDSQWKILGDPTEGALMTLSEKGGFSLKTVQKNHEKIAEFPFDSVRKCMSVIAHERDTKNITAYVKGAPDSILALCTHFFKDGAIEPMTQADKETMMKRTELMAHRSLRTIALAYKKLPESQEGDELASKIKEKYTQDEVERDLVFIGLTGMLDPPRDEVKEAVKLTHKAGIRVFIITGDYGLTAHAVAKEIGLAKTYGVHIITGEMLNKMSDEKVQSYLKPGQETIFARVSPEHKLRVVSALKTMGEVVAVTGDGVNDAPALKRADIGIAMGITGTDVSKEAANMVLADDSFATIVSAVIEGRTIYENMKKFIYYIFSSNIGELMAIFIGIAMGLPAPLTAIFMLIINTLTDVFPSLALGIEPVEKTILDKAPRRPGAKIMEWKFLRRCLGIGAWIGLVSFAAFLGNLWTSGWTFQTPIDTDSELYRQSATMAFAAMTLVQMVQALNSRSEHTSVFRMRFFENPYLLGAIAFTVVSTVAVIQIPFFETYLKTSALSIYQWLGLVVMAFSVLLVEEVRKFFTRRKRVKNPAV